MGQAFMVLVLDSEPQTKGDIVFAAYSKVPPLFFIFLSLTFYLESSYYP